MVLNVLTPTLPRGMPHLRGSEEEVGGGAGALSRSGPEGKEDASTRLGAEAGVYVGDRPDISEGHRSCKPHYEPWTLASRWERSIAEKVQDFGGILLQHGPALFIVAFGIPQTLDQMPQSAVQAALMIQRFLTEAVGRWWGAVPGAQAGGPPGRGARGCSGYSSCRQLLAAGDTLSLPVRLLGLSAPGEILVSPQVGRVVEGWVELQDEPCLGADSGDQANAYAVVGSRPRRVPLAMHGG